jgi:hypothetical protein
MLQSSPWYCDEPPNEVFPGEAAPGGAALTPGEAWARRWTGNGPVLVAVNPDFAEAWRLWCLGLEPDAASVGIFCDGCRL